MSQESTVNVRSGVVIAVAAAALTLAAGVTVGSMLGWVGPSRAAPADSPANAPAEAAPNDPAPSAPAIADDATTFARSDSDHERRPHHGRRRSHRKEHDHDD